MGEEKILMYKKLILGGPGAGKTTRLLEIMDEELSRGLKPYSIAFVSFTKKAVTEAKRRAALKFKLKEKDFLFFRTLHSLCHYQLGIKPDQVLRTEHLREIGDLLGVPIIGKMLVDDDSGMKDGDQMLFMDNLARNVQEDLIDIYHKTNWDLSWSVVERFSKTLKAYKQERGLIDFTDMLQNFTQDGDDIGVEVAIIDEAQDLTALQWQVVDIAFSKAKRIYIAGDDDQAIYEWSGADINHFLKLGEDEQEILPYSYRLPKMIFNEATALTKRISKRYKKKLQPRADLGQVIRCSSLDQIDLTTTGTWLLLARNVCFLPILQEACITQGISYTMRGWFSSVNPDEVQIIQEYERLRKGEIMVDEVKGEEILRYLGQPRNLIRGAYRLSGLVSFDPGIWHDAMTGLTADKRAYYLTILRAGRKLTGIPRVHLDTIHGVKGGEADHVVLLTDLTRATEEHWEKNPSAENRVFYVGMTRAKQNLFLVTPTTDRGFYI